MSLCFANNIISLIANGLRIGDTSLTPYGVARGGLAAALVAGGSVDWMTAPWRAGAPVSMAEALRRLRRG